MVIRELLIRLGLTGTDSAGKGLDKVDDKVKKLTKGFNGLGGAIAGALAGFSLQSIIHVADEMQSLEFRLGQMITSTNGGAEAIENLSKHASSARVNIEAYAESYTGIGAATHELIKTEQDLLNVTDSVAMGLQLAGANTQQTTSVMMQLTQAIAVGKLQWADMRIIMQNSDAFALRLAKSLGMTLNEMVKATQGSGGGIGADKIVSALRNMSDEVKKEFSSMPMTVHQALQIIGNRLDMFIHKMNRSSSAISWIAGKFLWLADKVEYSLDVVTDALGGAENAVKLLGVALGAAGLVGAVYLVTTAFAALTSPIFLVILALSALFLVGEDINSWLKGQKSLLGDMIGPVSEYTKAIDGIKAVVQGTVEQIKALVNIMSELDKAMQSSVLMDINNAVVGSAEWARNALGLNDVSGQGGISDELKNSAEGWRKYNERTAAEKSFSGKPTSLLSTPNTLESMTRSAGAAYDRDRSLMGGTFAPNTSVYITVPVGTPTEQQGFIRQTAQETYGELSTKLGNTLNFNTGG